MTLMLSGSIGSPIYNVKGTVVENCWVKHGVSIMSVMDMVALPSGYSKVRCR